MPVSSGADNVHDELAVSEVEVVYLDRVCAHDLCAGCDNVGSLVDGGEGERGKERADLSFGRPRRSGSEMLKRLGRKLGRERGRGREEMLEKRLEGVVGQHDGC